MYLNDRGREYFYKYSHLNKHIDKVISAKKIIKDYLDICPNTYLSWSTGKDSTVVLHLLRSIDSSIPVIHFDLGVELPNTDAYKQNFENITTYKSKKTVLDLYEEFGFECSESRKSKMIEEFTKNNKFDGNIMGLRYDESKTRNYLRRLGHTYTRKSDNMIICNPIHNWTFEDVFAYLISSNVPIHPHYYLNSLQPLEHRRVGGYLSSRNRGSGYGRFSWFKEQYPNEFARLVEKHKEINNYI